MKLVILRPQPGASATQRRAEARGWETAVVPLFRIEPRDWEPPDPRDFDAVLMTSANAAGEAGPGLDRYRRLPLYAVGEATAKAARGAGFDDIVSGAGGVAELADRLRNDGMERVLHLAGEDVRAFDDHDLSVVRLPVYASVPADPEGLEEALRDCPVVALHSPRAASAFARLCDERGVDRGRIAVAAISRATLAEAGEGWRAAAAAARPSDEALLKAARSLA